MAAVVAIAFVAVAAVIFLVIFLARRGGPRTVLWSVLLILAVPVTLAVLSLALLYYEVPVWAWAAVGACAIGVITLFVLLGRSVQWRALPVVASVALLLASVTLGAFALMIIPTAPTALLEARAAQIAEANGFTVLLPPGEQMQADYQPVNALPEPDAGLSIEYEHFVLQQRKADGPLAATDLEALVAPGASIGDRQPIPEDVVTSALTVRDNPAITAEYVDVPPESTGKPGEGERTRLLAFGLEGVEVVLWSTTWFDCTSDGECAEMPPLTVEELVAIADSLEPVA